MILLVGCSSVLGIDDPKPVIDSGATPPDVTTTSTDRLTVSLTDVKLAQGQLVRLHVLLVHQDTTMQDVTQSATLTSSNAAVAKGGGPGQINGVQAGTATITASLGTAMPATVSATVTSVMCHPVINELTPGTTAAKTNEWVEIYNPCVGPVTVVGWTLVFRGAMSTATMLDSGLLRTLTGSMASGELRLFAGTGYGGANDGTFLAGSGLGQPDGAVGLRAGPRDTGTLMDSIAYGDVAKPPDPNPFTETNATPTIGDGINAVSASRRPFDGNDTNDNATDFVMTATSTPGALNVP
jgi:hypothetical protein